MEFTKEELTEAVIAYQADPTQEKKLSEILIELIQRAFKICDFIPEKMKNEETQADCLDVCLDKIERLSKPEKANVYFATLLMCHLRQLYRSSVLSP